MREGEGEWWLCVRESVCEGQRKRERVRERVKRIPCVYVCEREKGGGSTNPSDSPRVTVEPILTTSGPGTNLTGSDSPAGLHPVHVLNIFVCVCVWRSPEGLAQGTLRREYEMHGVWVCGEGKTGLIQEGRDAQGIQDSCEIPGGHVSRQREA